MKLLILCPDSLPQKLPAVVLLEAGHRPVSANQALIRHQTAPGIKLKIWQRTEIENYLLDPETIARVSGAAAEIIALRINEFTASLRESSRSNFISEWIELVRGTEIIKELDAWRRQDHLPRYRGSGASVAMHRSPSRPA
jgi:hypothetical protein